jgi:hypothetical protein
VDVDLNQLRSANGVNRVGFDISAACPVSG